MSRKNHNRENQECTTDAFQKTSNFSWEVSYKSVDSKRLWPDEPTIEGLDFNLWHTNKITTVLDAGCGDGKNMACLTKKGFHCVGVDASSSALKLCNDYLKGWGITNYTLHPNPCKLESLPFNSNQFNAAICIDVLGHIIKPNEILSELARVLCPGGFLYTNIFHLDDSCHQSKLRMEAGEGPGEFWYTPSCKNSTNPDLKYYYRFYSENEARNLFNSNSFELISLERREWHESGHEKYREEDHTQVSWFALMRQRRI